MSYSYYTPEIIAYYFYKNDYGINEVYDSIKKLYESDFIFIDPAYKSNKEKFKTNIMNYLDYLDDKEEYLKNIEDVKIYYDELNIELEDVPQLSSIDYFFITVRLDKIFSNKNFKRIKLRTLLKEYGYKRRSDNFILHIYACMLFYHIKGYYNNEEINLFDLNIDNMITFKITDY